MKFLINYKPLSQFSASELHEICKEVATWQRNPFKLAAMLVQPVCPHRTGAMHPPGQTWMQRCSSPLHSCSSPEKQEAAKFTRIHPGVKPDSDFP